MQDAPQSHVNTPEHVAELLSALTDQKVCEHCRDPLPPSTNPHNARRKRFCCDKCRSAFFWAANLERLANDPRRPVWRERAKQNAKDARKRTRKTQATA